jgi:hypothetical protein
MMTGCGAAPSRSSTSRRGSLSSLATLPLGSCHRYLPSSSLCWSSMGFSFIIYPPFSCTGGNLCPLLRDVHLCEAIGHPVQAVPHAMMGWEWDEPDWHLLLPAPCQGSDSYIAAITPGKWDRWREDWAIVRVDAQDLWRCSMFQGFSSGSPSSVAK